MDNKEVRQKFAEIIEEKLNAKDDEIVFDPILDLEESIWDLYEYLNHKENSDLRSVYLILNRWWLSRDCSKPTQKPLPGWNLSVEKSKDLLQRSIKYLSDGKKILDEEILRVEEIYESKNVIYRLFHFLNWWKEPVKMRVFLINHVKGKDVRVIFPMKDFKFLEDEKKHVLWSNSYGAATDSMFKLILENLPFDFEKGKCCFFMIPYSTRFNDNESQNFQNLEFSWGKENAVYAFPKEKNYNPLHDYLDLMIHFGEFGNSGIYEVGWDVDLHIINKNVKEPNLSVVFNDSSIFFWQDEMGYMVLGMSKDYGNWKSSIKRRIVEGDWIPKMR